MKSYKKLTPTMTEPKLHRIAAAAIMAAASLTATAADIHVATTGNDQNPGTAEAPLLTIHRALEMVAPGDRILIHEGTYVISERIKIPALATSAERRCEMRAWPDDAVGRVVIDGSAMNHTTESGFKMGRCIYVNHLANYWTFYGLVLQHAEDNGMKVEGSYNVIERCTFRWNNDTGLQIGMYKDFSIEETKALPISGQPQYNPGYTYCRGNKVVNCDAYENADTRSYNGSDDGGDADGFACKLFPGPGTEFHGCRAWTNSDDNWDLYMVYHPVVIDHCWAWHAGYLSDGSEGKNGNGFKLGGGGSAGGAAFDQSVGAHVVTNCVAFGNLHKGFDQNNAYEGMYIINCTAWGNEYNYRFPTLFKYGTMTIRNCIGWGATAEKSNVAVGNHEFLSPDKEGYKDPDTDFNSWTTLDGCSPIKEGYKEGKTQVVTRDYSGEFLSLSADDFLAPRQVDGSLPDNGFARLKPGSVMKDKGTPIIGFTPARKMTASEAAAAGLELVQADDLYIGYNDAAPDFGAFELDGTPAEFTIPEKITLACTTANTVQEVVEGQPIEPIVYELGTAATAATVSQLADGLSYTVEGHTVVISGTPASGCTYTLTATGDAEAGVKPVSAGGTISVVKPFRELTGGWYHFQDAWDQLPADLQGVLQLIDGQIATAYSPERTESSGDVPGGCTVGGIDMAKGGGGLRFTFADGVLQLLVNLHFTGDRTYKLTWTLADGTTGATTTDKMKKQTLLAWDLIALTGVADPTQLRELTLQNNSTSGGARIYDVYIRIPDIDATAVSAPAATAAPAAVKRLSGGRLVVSRAGNDYNLQGQQLK